MPLLLRLFIVYWLLEDPGQRGLSFLYGLFSLLYGLNVFSRLFQSLLFINRIAVLVIADYFAIVFLAL